MVLNILCKIARNAALAAGEIIAAKQGGAVNIHRKEGGENIASQVVTEVDINAEKAILELLNPTLLEYNIGLLAEESASEDESRFNKDYFWAIDPLDGTLCFSRDEDGYSTSIALIRKDGTPMIGVVYNPRSQTLYHAIKDQGAFKNDTPFKAPNWGNKLTLLYDQSFLKHPTYKNQIQQLEEGAKKLGLDGVEMFHLGGAVMNGITTIEMAPAIYYKPPKKALGGGSIWDFAASSIIQSEAGGFNGNYFHKPLDLNRSDSTFMNHEGVIYCTDHKVLEIVPQIEE